MKLFELQEKMPSVKTHNCEEIAKKHNVPVSTIKAQLKKGQKVEMEHTKDVATAKEIAHDHIWERPDYYDKLEQVEKDDG